MAESNVEIVVAVSADSVNKGVDKLTTAISNLGKASERAVESYAKLSSKGVEAASGKISASVKTTVDANLAKLQALSTSFVPIKDSSTALESFNSKVNKTIRDLTKLSNKGLLEIGDLSKLHSVLQDFYAKFSSKDFEKALNKQLAKMRTGDADQQKAATDVAASVKKFMSELTRSATVGTKTLLSTLHKAYEDEIKSAVSDRFSTTVVSPTVQDDVKKLAKIPGIATRFEKLLITRIESLTKLANEFDKSVKEANAGKVSESMPAFIKNLRTISATASSRLDEMLNTLAENKGWNLGEMKQLAERLGKARTELKTVSESSKTAFSAQDVKQVSQALSEVMKLLSGEDLRKTILHQIATLTTEGTENSIKQAQSLRSFIEGFYKATNASISQSVTNLLNNYASMLKPVTESPKSAYSESKTQVEQKDVAKAGEELSRAISAGKVAGIKTFEAMQTSFTAVQLELKAFKDVWSDIPESAAKQVSVKREKMVTTFQGLIAGIFSPLEKMIAVLDKGATQTGTEGDIAKLKEELSKVAKGLVEISKDAKVALTPEHIDKVAEAMRLVKSELYADNFVKYLHGMVAELRKGDTSSQQLAVWVESVYKGIHQALKSSISDQLNTIKQAITSATNFAGAAVGKDLLAESKKSGTPIDPAAMDTTNAGLDRAKKVIEAMQEREKEIREKMKAFKSAGLNEKLAEELIRIQDAMNFRVELADILKKSMNDPAIMKYIEENFENGKRMVQHLQQANSSVLRRSDTASQKAINDTLKRISDVADIDATIRELSKQGAEFKKDLWAAIGKSYSDPTQNQALREDFIKKLTARRDSIAVIDNALSSQDRVFNNIVNRVEMFTSLKEGLAKVATSKTDLDKASELSKITGKQIPVESIVFVTNELNRLLATYATTQDYSKSVEMKLDSDRQKLAKLKVLIEQDGGRDFAAKGLVDKHDNLERALMDRRSALESILKSKTESQRVVAEYFEKEIIKYRALATSTTDPAQLKDISTSLAIAEKGLEGVVGSLFGAMKSKLSRNLFDSTFIEGLKSRLMSATSDAQRMQVFKDEGLEVASITQLRVLTGMVNDAYMRYLKTTDPSRYASIKLEERKQKMETELSAAQAMADKFTAKGQEIPPFLTNHIKILSDGLKKNDIIITTKLADKAAKMRSELNALEAAVSAGGLDADTHAVFSNKIRMLTRNLTELIKKNPGLTVEESITKKLVRVQDMLIEYAKVANEVRTNPTNDAAKTRLAEVRAQLQRLIKDSDPAKSAELLYEKTRAEIAALEASKVSLPKGDPMIKFYETQMRLLRNRLDKYGKDVVTDAILSAQADMEHIVALNKSLKKTSPGSQEYNALVNALYMSQQNILTNGNIFVLRLQTWMQQIEIRLNQVFHNIPAMLSAGLQGLSFAVQMPNMAVAFIKDVKDVFETLIFGPLKWGIELFADIKNAVTKIFTATWDAYNSYSIFFSTMVAATQSREIEGKKYSAQLLSYARGESTPRKISYGANVNTNAIGEGSIEERENRAKVIASAAYTSKRIVDEFKIVSEIATMTGARISEVSKAFGILSASLAKLPQGADMAADVVRGISMGAAVYHLDAGQLAYSFKAIRDAASKGVVSLEEFKKQLGNQIPDAMGILARGLGKTEAELLASIKSGTINVNLAIRAFAAQFEFQSIESMKKLYKSANLQWGRFQTLIDKTSTQFWAGTPSEAGGKEEIVTGLNKSVGEFLMVWTKALGSLPASAGAIGDSFGRTITSIAAALQRLDVSGKPFEAFLATVTARISTFFDAIAATIDKLDQNELQNIFKAISTPILSFLDTMQQELVDSGQLSENAKGTAAGFLASMTVLLEASVKFEIIMTKIMILFVSFTEGLISFFDWSSKVTERVKSDEFVQGMMSTPAGEQMKLGRRANRPFDAFKAQAQSFYLQSGEFVGPPLPPAAVNIETELAQLQENQKAAADSAVSFQKAMSVMNSPASMKIFRDLDKALVDAASKSDDFKSSGKAFDKYIIEISKNAESWDEFSKGNDQLKSAVSAFSNLTGVEAIGSLTQIWDQLRAMSENISTAELSKLMDEGTKFAAKSMNTSLEIQAAIPLIERGFTATAETAAGLTKQQELLEQDPEFALMVASFGSGITQWMAKMVRAMQNADEDIKADIQSKIDWVKAYVAQADNTQILRTMAQQFNAGNIALTKANGGTAFSQQFQTGLQALRENYMNRLNMAPTAEKKAAVQQEWEDLQSTLAKYQQTAEAQDAMANAKAAARNAGGSKSDPVASKAMQLETDLMKRLATSLSALSGYYSGQHKGATKDLASLTEELSYGEDAKQIDEAAKAKLLGIAKLVGMSNVVGEYAQRIYDQVQETNRVVDETEFMKAMPGLNESSNMFASIKDALRTYGEELKELNKMKASVEESMKSAGPLAGEQQKVLAEIQTAILKNAEGLADIFRRASSIVDQGLVTAREDFDKWMRDFSFERSQRNVPEGQRELNRMGKERSDAYLAKTREISALRQIPGAEGAGLIAKEEAAREEIDAQYAAKQEVMRAAYEEDRTFLGAIGKIAEERASQLKTVGETFAEAMFSIGDALSDSISDFIQTGKFKLTDFADMVKKTLADIAASYASALLSMGIQKGVQALVNGLSGGISGGGGGGSFGPNAAPTGGVKMAPAPLLAAFGQVFNGGRVIPFANGGVISSPSYFDIGLMGEAGPEAIMPLSRDSSGRLGVRGTNSTSVSNNQVVITVNMTSEGTGGRDEGMTGDKMKNIGEMIKASVVKIVAEESRKGGVFNQYRSK